MNALPTALAGFSGALALNAAHEGVRKLYPHAPHVDIVGMRAMGKTLRRIGRAPEDLRHLRRLTLAADVLSNSLYYAVALGTNARASWTRVALWGLAAGIGAVVLPPMLDLGDESSRSRADTALLTVAYYTLGALVAGAVGRRLRASPSLTRSSKAR